MRASTHARNAACLSLILAGALLLRVPAIRWGLPPAIPAVVASDIRCSYSFDEDDVLTDVSFSRMSTFRFRLYHWGTLHFALLLPWMEAAEKLGYIGHPWRAAYYNMVPGAFERVYEAGRALSVLAALASIALVFLLGAAFENARAGLWASALVAVSPAHLLASTQIRVDLTMTAFVVLAAWFGLRCQRSAHPWRFAFLGIAAGLAVTAKYPALLIVAPIIIAALRPSCFHRASMTAVLLGVAAGVIIGQPYLLADGGAMFRQLREIVTVTAQVPPGLRFSVPGLLGMQVLNTVRFVLGPAGAVLAGAGLWLIARRRSPRDWLVMGALGGGVLTLIPLAWPLLRYDVPLLPFLAVAAGVALVSLEPRWRWAAGSACLAFPLAASIAQLQYMRAKHPANQALEVILARVPPGTPIARLARELPPLDTRRYPLGPNPFLEEIARNPPEWVLTADLPFQPYPDATRRLLAERYEPLADLGLPRAFSWASLGERGAPHDWKYTHPHMVLYHRRGP